MSEPNRCLEEALFEAALARTSAAERAAFLDAACRGNPALRARLDVLLKGHFHAEGFLPAGPAPAASQPDFRPPAEEAASTYVGRYKLLEKIGEGGFGEVWMAEQKEPVKRRVALKIIKLGMDTKQVVARFEAERQALAMMDHPNIAKVFDGGATDTGRPYFVMELVRGVRITEYCDSNQVSTHERLRLFIQVCRAVQHAHQKGVIHRDIKPSNILVTLHDGVPVPKVIDFGIAKATQQQLTDKTVFTQFRQFLGTPAYVSPEQAEMSGLDVDTRSDLYSLGVLLYELLTGKTPFDSNELLAAGLDELRRRIRETPPVRPSARLTGMTKEELTTTAQRRGAEPPKLISLVRGDLDWIVMKCLEKDRSRRYETANGLVRDIERHLGHEPVLARPPSRLYEFQRTVWRHWVGFTAAGAVLAALAVGAVASRLEAVRAHRAEAGAHRAEADQAKQRAAAQQFLYQSLVGKARATRLARRLGYRDQVFTLLGQARALDVPDKDVAYLRQEAVACLGDFVGFTPDAFSDFPAKLDSARACLAPSGNLAAFVLSDRTILLREMPQGRQVARLALTNELTAVCFNLTGDQLFAITGPASASRSAALLGRRVRGWARQADGQWGQFVERPAPGATKGIFSTESGVFDVTLEFAASSSGEPGTRDARFKLLDLLTGDYVPGHEVRIVVPAGGQMEFAVSGDGRVLAVGTTRARTLWAPSSAIAVKLHEWKRSQPIAQFSVTNSGTLSLSDNGKYFSVLSDAGGVIYAVPGMTRVAQFNESYPGPPARICGDLIALSRREQNRIRLRDLSRAQDIALLEEPEATTPVGFSANGDCLLSVGATHARLYQLATPEKLELPAHTAPVPGVAFSPDGSRLASVGRDRVVRVCDALTGRMLWETNALPDWGQCVGYSRDGRWLAIGIWTRDLVCIRDAQTGQRLLEVGSNEEGQVWSAQFSPDRRYLAAAGPSTNGIKIWRLDEAGTDPANVNLTARLFRAWEGGMSLVFSPDGHSISFCAPFNEPSPLLDRDGADLWLWDYEKSAQPRRLASGIKGGNLCQGFTLDSRRLVAVDTNGDILIMEADTGKQTGACHAELPRQPMGVQPSPDGSKLAIRLNTASGGAVELVDALSGKLLYALPAEAGNVFWLAWSPDSRRLAVSRDNGNIAIWNLDTINQILAQQGLNP